MDKRPCRPRNVLVAYLGVGCALGALIGIVQPAMARLACDPAERPIGTCESYTCNTTEGFWYASGNLANGSTCNDFNACTSGDTCLNGTCKGGAAVVCAPVDACHFAGSCVSLTGCGIGPPKNDGDYCDDYTRCNGRETCRSGVCTAGSPANVDDGNACTVDSCAAATGAITHTPISGLCCNAGTVMSGQYCGAVGGAECACSAQAQCLISKGVTRFGYDGASSMTERTVRAVGQACAALP